MGALSRYWWMGALAAVGLLLVAATCEGVFKEPGEGKDPSSVTNEDCTRIQQLVSSMVSPLSSPVSLDEKNSILRAVAVQILGDDPSILTPGDLESRGFWASEVECSVSIDWWP